MNVTNLKFTTRHWPSENVIFEPITEVPSIELITSCMVFAIDNDQKQLVLSKPKRGWGLPGGHREQDETPSQCAIREFYEETNITIKNLQIIGRNKIEKIVKTDQNSKYPDLGYMIFYLAQIDKIDNFESNFETSEREFVSFDNLHLYIDKTNIQFYEMFDYVISIINDRKNRIYLDSIFVG